MKVLFVSSGNSSNFDIAPFIKSQGESLRAMGVDVQYFPVNGKGILGYLRAAIGLKNCLKKQPIDIIHAHYGWCGLVALLSRRNQKIVVSFMGDDIVGTVGKNRRYTLTGNMVAGLNIFLAGHFYDYVIVKSDGLLSRISRNKNIAVIPNGVDFNAFYEFDSAETKAKVRLAVGKKYIVFVANPFRPEKNYELASQAVFRADQADTELLPLYNIPNHDLVYYYNAAACLVLTSFHEGSPNVIKEAMACNCPIVSTDVGDVRWVLGNTEGCFIASFDPCDFAAKIQLALDFVHKKGRTRGRERLIELGLDAETVAKKILAVYRKVLN